MSTVMKDACSRTLIAQSTCCRSSPSNCTNACSTGPAARDDSRSIRTHWSASEAFSSMPRRSSAALRASRLYALLLLQHLHPHLLRLARHALLLLERLLEDRVALGELRLHLLARLVGHGAAAHAAGCAASTARGSGRRQLRLQLLDLRLELPNLGHLLVLARLELDRLRAVGVLRARVADGDTSTDG